MTDNIDPIDDLFSDAYIGGRNKRYANIEAIENELANESADKKATRHAKHTRAPRAEGPETKVKAAVKKHLETVWRARVLRTNAGRIRTAEGHDVFLGDTGQADIHALVPYALGGFTFGLFLAVETKAGTNVATTDQLTYLDNIRKRGGIGVVAYNIVDVDDAIGAHIMKLIDWAESITARKSDAKNA